MRFDRRKTYPEPNILDVLIAEDAIVPRRIGGVIKAQLNDRIHFPVNVAVGKIRSRTQYLIPGIRMSSGGTSPFFGSLIGLDLSAKVIESFPNPFAPGEEQAISDFINSQIRAGNWSEMESFTCYALSDPANALWDMQQLRTQVSVGAVHIPGKGYSTIGGTYINTKNNPSEAVRYSQDNAQYQFYIGDLTLQAGDVGFLGNSLDLDSGVYYRNNGINTRVQFAINGDRESGSAGQVTAHSLRGAERFTPTTMVEIVNATIGGDELADSTPPIDAEVYLGIGDSGDLGADATFATFMGGKSVGFNQLAYWQDTVTLVTALGAI